MVYLGFALTTFTKGGDQKTCTRVNMVVADSMHAGFITPEGVEKILKKGKVYPVGLPYDSVDNKVIEDVLAKDPFVKEATCYKTASGQVNIIIEQRLPILRVLADNGEDYYVDEKGYQMKATGYEADLPVVTGNVKKEYVQKHLVEVGKYLQSEPFWNNQVEQINVTADEELEFVMRVGNTLVEVGAPVNIPTKLRNLSAFYKKVMPEVGWDRYKSISVAYENQIICKK